MIPLTRLAADQKTVAERKWRAGPETRQAAKAHGYRPVLG